MADSQKRADEETAPAPKEERRVRFEDSRETKREPEVKKEKEADVQGCKELVYRKSVTSSRIHPILTKRLPP